MAAVIRIEVQTSGGVDAVKKDLAGLGEQAKSAGGGFSSLKEVATGALREVGALAVNALGQAATAVAGFLKDSVSVAGDFQSGMLEFQAVAGKGVDTTGLQQFHDLFISLGKELPVSTADVQKAAIELVKGGIDPATIAAGGLEQSIKFAAAAMGGDLAAAAETSAKIVGGWADVTATAQEKADLLTHATDLLTKAANASTVDVKDLSLGLYNVQGTAKAAGLSLDETTTALAELAPRFSNANTAGTSFRNFLMRLQPSTKPATDAMQELGLMTTSTTRIMDFLKEQGIKPLGADLDTLGNQFTEFATAQGWTAKETTKVWESFAQSKFFDEATGKFVGVAQASTLLQDATKGLTDAQKLQALQQIFGNDAMNAAAAFAEMGAAGYNNMTAALVNANGVSDNAALKQQGLNTAMENFKGSIEALQITIGEALLPVLTDLFNNVLAPAVNTVTGLADGSLTFDQALTNLSATVTGAIPSLLQMVGAGTEVQTAFTDIQATALSVFGSLVPYITGAMNAIGAYVGAVTAQIAAFWQAHGAEIMAFVKQTWDTVWDIISTVAKIVYTIISQQFGAAAAFINAHGTQIQQFLSNAWTIISNLITGALALIQGVLKATLSVMQGDWSGAWSAIQQACETATVAIWNIIKGVLDLIAGLFNTSLQGIMDVWANNWEQIKNYVANIDWASVGQNVIDGIASGITGAAQRLADAAAGAAKDAYEAAKSALGISSPSKLFAKGVGFPIAQGMAQGILKGAPLVGAAAAQAGTGAAGATASIINNTTYNTLNFSPSYGSGGGVRMDYSFAKSLAGVA